MEKNQQKTSKREYKKILKAVFEKNALLLNKYNYAYSGSLVLFRNIPSWKKIPEDMDVAVDRNGKGVKELITFYNRLQRKSYVKEVIFMTVSEGKYTINKKEYTFKKRETIPVGTINPKVFEKLLECGNIRIEYRINGILTELFIEKGGNGLTNLGTMRKELWYKTYQKEDGKGLYRVPFLGYEAIAQGYAMNFLKEVVYNNIYRLSDSYSKPKDGLRLNSIVTLLKYAGKIITPRAILAFIEKTVHSYKKLPEKRRCLYIQKAIKEYDWIKEMLMKIIEEYEMLAARYTGEKKKKQFMKFYKRLGKYKSVLHANIDYIQHDILELLKKDIRGEKYIITDVVGELSHEKHVRDKLSLKKLIKKLNRVEDYLESVAITSQDESFPYFYEMYMFKNLFIKPIKKALPEHGQKFAK